MIALTILLSLCAGVLLLPTLSDLLSLARAARRRPPPPPPAPRDLPRLLFLVPAHNEELLIASCVESLSRMSYPPQRFGVSVIADNCSDRTAQLAHQAGARCLERHEPDRPGKPSAIAWALARLDLHRWDALVIIDADTLVAPDFALVLAQSGSLREVAVQAFYDVRNRGDTALTRLGALLGSANHLFAYALKERVGLNVPLVGNGMCLGTGVLRRFGWPALSICEDWEMFALLTAAGVRIKGAPKAAVYAQEARTLRQSYSQRRRWTAGKLTVLGRYSWRLVRSVKASVCQKLDALAELTAPGPATQLGVVTLLAGGLLFLDLPSAHVLATMLGVSLVRPAVYTLAALSREPQPGRAAAALAFLPVYALWRLATGIAAVPLLGNAPWIRTQRHDTTHRT